MTTTSDFRELCEQLLEVIEGEYEGTGACYELRHRARIALAAPPPEPPPDDELIEIARQLRETAGYLQLGCGWDRAIKAIESASILIEGDLFQRLKPPPEPPTDEEIEEWADAATEVPLEEMDPDVHGWRRCFTKEEFWASIRAALERWGAK